MAQRERKGVAALGTMYIDQTLRFNVRVAVKLRGCTLRHFVEKALKAELKKKA